MHIPWDPTLPPCWRNPRVWDISDPFKNELFRRGAAGAGSSPDYFGDDLRVRGSSRNSQVAFPREKQGKKLTQTMELFPLPPRPPRSAGKKKKTQTLPGVVSISSPISPRLNPKPSPRDPKKLQSPGVPLSFIHCGSLNSRGLGSRLPGIKTFPLLWLP